MNSINFCGKILDFGTPKVMGILNCTPDSFYDGGKYNLAENAIEMASKMVAEGADIIDIGGMSTRPGASMVHPEEELGRVIPVIRGIRTRFPEAVISIDTFRTSVARAALDAGAGLINDISGGSLDDEMFHFVAEAKVPYILMHMQGTPGDMQINPRYEDVVSEIFMFFNQKLRELKILGLNEVIIDPGFGFGKTVTHNFDLLKKLEVFQIFDHVVLAGLSRKSMLYKTIGGGPEDALSATAAAHMIALQKGAKILRVHDVKEARDVIRIYAALQDDH